MAKFVVREILWLQSRGELVLAGNIEDGSFVAGMQALFWLDSQAYYALAATSVEFIDRLAVGESLVGLVCSGVSAEDAKVCAELCTPGDVIEVTETERAV